jgi:hypothetical protein
MVYEFEVLDENVKLNRIHSPQVYLVIIGPKLHLVYYMLLPWKQTQE